jgi:hypothetical protein
MSPSQVLALFGAKDYLHTCVEEGGDGAAVHDCRV